MADQEIGWIAAIIIGGLAGWLAELVMKSDTGVAGMMNTHSWHRSSGGGQRDSKLFRHRSWRMGRLPYRRVRWSMFVDRNRARGARHPRRVKICVQPCGNFRRDQRTAFRCCTGVPLLG